MNITIKTIPHQYQRYDTIGDWWFDASGDLHIRVSQIGNQQMESLVAVHELIETLLCMSKGITQEQVDLFDMSFERDRPKGDDSEPGDDPMAPYFNEHQFASIVERLLARELGVDWQDYERRLASLS